MRTSDTSPEAQALHLQLQQNMAGEQRLELAFEMSLFARDLWGARIQQEHPDWSEASVARELLRLAFLPNPLPADFRYGLPDSEV